MFKIEVNFHTTSRKIQILACRVKIFGENMDPVFQPISIRLLGGKLVSPPYVVATDANGATDPLLQDDRAVTPIILMYDASQSVKD